MIDENSLRVKQAEFEDIRKEFKKELIKLEEKRQKFLKLFPKEKLSELELEKYALQKGKAESKNSFCYWLENELRDPSDEEDEDWQVSLRNTIINLGKLISKVRLTGTIKDPVWGL